MLTRQIHTHYWLFQKLLYHFKAQRRLEMATASGMWQNLKDNVHFAQSSERQRATLMQFGALLAFMVDEAHVGTTARMEFVFRFRLAIFSMSVWDQLEALVSRTLTKYPVSSSFRLVFYSEH